MEGAGSEVSIGRCAIETDRCVSLKFKSRVTERKWKECNEGEREWGYIARQIKRKKTFPVNCKFDSLYLCCSAEVFRS